ncbi:hypothetical protein [Streptomyces canus]|uniref:hypothetical protein n=1 Tax=Streptomyces canus TaxID=58343 RepID=UPI002DD7AB4E|nr:hypothetical protein [Streptomyces canus]WSD85309.1 hypothetical protein OG925_13845 [Streptomyces canus]
MAFLVPASGPKPLLGLPVGSVGGGRCGRTWGPGGAYGVAGTCIRITEHGTRDRRPAGLLPQGWLRESEGSRTLIAEDRPERHVSASREFIAGK